MLKLTKVWFLNVDSSEPMCARVCGRVYNGRLLHIDFVCVFRRQMHSCQISMTMEHCVLCRVAK